MLAGTRLEGPQRALPKPDDPNKKISPLPLNQPPKKNKSIRGRCLFAGEGLKGVPAAQAGLCGRPLGGKGQVGAGRGSGSSTKTVAQSSWLRRETVSSGVLSPREGG